MAGKRKSNNKKWQGLGFILVLAILFAAYKVLGPATGELTRGEVLYIRTGATYLQVCDSLNKGGYVKDIFTFDLLAKQARYPSRVKPGKYRITRSMSNYHIIRMLRSGRQTPVKLVINKLRTKNDFITLIASGLEANPDTLRKLLADPAYAAQFGQDTNTIICAVIPDTYEFYWNTTADKAFRKIQKNYTVFWNEARKQKAKAQELTPQKVIIIASLVEEETNKAADKPIIASVYINRLAKDMKLQADPTIRFALNDFTIRRVTGTHLEISSPYNTYINAGLPPGPICTPSKKSIDAVLNAPATKYLYFCAKEDFSGYSRFASNYTDHQKNAKLYQQALDTRGIK